MADTQEERSKRDEQIRETIMAKLVETGEKDRLKEMLRDRLIQCGWRDELKEFCKDVIRRKGLEKVTVEELVAEITPQGRSKFTFNYSFFFIIKSLFIIITFIATVPEEVKAELLKRIRTFLQAT
jgi:enhancer of yellow 2 transcription factor